MLRSPQSDVYGSNPELSSEPRVTIRKRKLPDCDCSAAVNKMNDDLKVLLSNTIVQFQEMLDRSLTQVSTDIKSEISELREDFNSIKQQVSKLNNTLQATTQDVSSLQESLELQINEHNLLKKRVENLSSQNTDYESLVNKIETLEQQARQNNIEICNVPEKQNENLAIMLEMIGTAIKQPIVRAEILSIHRVPHANKQEKTRPKNIIVKFSSRILRDNVISAFRIRKGLSTEDLGISGTSRKIYLNEHLTLRKKQLLRDCRLSAVKYNFKFVWVRNSTIFVRKTSDSPIFIIRTEKDLSKFTVNEDPNKQT